MAGSLQTNNQVNDPRPRRRGGALTAIAFLAVAVSQTVLAGTSTTTAYARPLATLQHQGTLPQVGASVSLPVTAPSWVAYPRAADAALPAGRQTVQVPILMYHYIRVPPDPGADRLGYNLSVAPQEFARQMDYLAQEGFHPVTLAQLQGYLEGTAALPDRPVVLTFDDGYADLYTEAFPVLRQHNFRAVAYIVSGFVGAAGRNVTPEQVKEMDAYGIEIGAHTFSHADLTKLGAEQLAAEVAGSKAQLEALVGHPVTAFCYPAGRFNQTVIDAVQAAGFSSATTTQEGVTHGLADRYTWSRVRVSGGESQADFAAALQSHEEGVAGASPTPVLIPRAYPLIFLGAMAGLK